MHDIWNPWHGCHKYSDDCKDCYIMYLDKIHNNSEGNIVYKTKNFNYPLVKDRYGDYKIKSSEMIRVCMNSNFFVEEIDLYREDAYKIIKKRSDVIFFILTKRIAMRIYFLMLQLKIKIWLKRAYTS